MSDDERPDSLAAQAAAWVPPWERAAREPDRAYQAAAEDEARAEFGAGQRDDATSSEQSALSAEGSETDSARSEAVAADRAAPVDAISSADESPGGESSAGADAAAESAGGSRRWEASARPGGGAADSGPAVGAPEDTESVDEAGLSDDDDDFDPAFEGPNPTVETGDDAASVDAEVDFTGAGAGAEGGSEAGVEPELASVDVAPGPELPLPEAIEDAVEAADEDEPGTPVDAPLPPEGDDAGDVFDAAADDDVSDDGEMDLPFADEVPVSSTEDDPEEESDIVDDDDDFDAVATPADEAASAGEGGPASDAAPAGGDAPASGAAPTGDAVPAPAGKAARKRGVTPSGELAARGDRAAAPARDAVSDGGPGADRLRDRAPGGDVTAGGAVPGGGGGAVGEGAAVPGQTRRVAPAELPVVGPVEVDLPGLTEDSELAAALEAIMLVVDEPVAELQLAQVLEQPTERIALMLDNLSARYTAAGHGFDLRRVAGGWRLYTRPEYAAYVERFVLDGQSVRLTQAALETLAVVAYKQPVTRSRISAIRGVNCDGVMRTLVTRGLIEECGTESETGAHLYRTTGLFLEKLGLNSVDQLPPLAPFLPDDVEEVLDATG